MKDFKNLMWLYFSRVVPISERISRCLLFIIFKKVCVVGGDHENGEFCVLLIGMVLDMKLRELRTLVENSRRLILDTVI